MALLFIFKRFLSADAAHRPEQQAAIKADHQKRSVAGSCNLPENSLTTSATVKKRHVTMMIGKLPNVIEMLLNFFDEATMDTVLETKRLF